MCSTRGARALPRAGCPIQKPPDHRLLPTPRRLSQVAASFFGSWCLGIHLGPLLACSTYNHSSTAEERPVGHVQKRKRIQILLCGILEISIDLFGCQCAGGDERIRTADPLLAKQVLSQLSYIPWGTETVLIATPVPFSSSLHGSCLPPRAERIRLRGRLSDLESLKSGKDRTKPWICLLVHSNENCCGISPRLRRLPATNRDRSSRVRDRTLCDLSLARSIANLRDLMTVVTANSDLTNPPKPYRGL